MTPDTKYDHSITVKTDGLTFTCEAAQESECRQYDCRPECAWSSTGSGECGALFFIDPCDPENTYNGSTDRGEWNSGPIAVEWSDEFGSYLWRFPGEPRDLPTDPQLSRRSAPAG